MKGDLVGAVLLLSCCLTLSCLVCVSSALYLPGVASTEFKVRLLWRLLLPRHFFFLLSSLSTSFWADNFLMAERLGGLGLLPAGGFSSHFSFPFIFQENFTISQSFFFKFFLNFFFFI